MFKNNLAVIAAAGLFTLTGCGNGYNGSDYWDLPEEKPEEPPVEEVKTPRARYIWIDLSANFRTFANSKENIAADLAKVADAGFSDIVVDVRGTNGDVIFKTSAEGVEQVVSINRWDGVVTRTETWDYLQAFIDEGHKLGLNVHAAINTMIGASNGQGMLLRDADKREWATTMNTANGLVNVLDLQSVGEKFFNPGHPKVQEFLCQLLSDLAKYDIDGIILDRGRYTDLLSDFSELSQTQFKEYVGVENIVFPDEVLPAGAKDIKNVRKYTKQWLEYRASVIHDFMGKARDAVKASNPKVKFGVYVGAWYGSYYEVGVNWASSKFNPFVSGYTWATKDYYKTGYAEYMDHMLLGAYANPLSVYGRNEWTIQGFCEKGLEKLCGDVPIVAGGPDVGNWSLNEIPDDQKEFVELNAVKNSVDAAVKGGTGYFLFDLCHLRLNPKKWDYVKDGLETYLMQFEQK